MPLWLLSRTEHCSALSKRWEWIFANLCWLMIFCSIKIQICLFKSVTIREYWELGWWAIVSSNVTSIWTWIYQYYRPHELPHYLFTIKNFHFDFECLLICAQFVDIVIVYAGHVNAASYSYSLIEHSWLKQIRMFIEIWKIKLLQMCLLLMLVLFHSACLFSRKSNISTALTLLSHPKWNFLRILICILQRKPNQMKIMIAKRHWWDLITCKFWGNVMKLDLLHAKLTNIFHIFGSCFLYYISACLIFLDCRFSELQMMLVYENARWCGRKYLSASEILNALRNFRSGNVFATDSGILFSS